MTATASRLSPQAFQRAADRGRRAAERELAAMETTYRRLLRRAGAHAAAALETTAALTAATPNWQPPPERTLLPDAELGNEAEARLARAHLRAVKAAAAPALERAGIAWDVSHPLIAELLADAGTRTGEALGAAVQPILRETVAEAYQDGLSVLDAADLIRSRITDAAPWQARMLARTDLNGLSNGGSVAAAKIVGIEHKRWLTAEDERVRHAHAAANGQTVPIDEPFSVGGEQLKFPGDPAGSNANVCNCRCTVVYVDDVEPHLTPGGVVAETASIISDSYVRVRPETASVTITVDEQTEPAAAQAWVSDLAFEGTATEDGRFILPGALGWRELPLTLMALTETGPGGHEGAFVGGRIDAIEKDTKFDMDGDRLPKGVTAVRATGVFDMGGDNGSEVARLVADDIVRGVSVDLAILDWALRDPDTGEILDPDALDEKQMERAMLGELQYAVRAATIMAATVCPTPAFADARIAVTASGDRVLRLWAPLGIRRAPITASASGLAPEKPPRAWFYTPEAAEPTPLTVTKDGRVFGHMALWTSCHTGYPGQCVPPPRSPSGYTYLNLGEVECDDGDRVAVGSLTLESLHADTHRPLKPDAVRAHYENTAVVAAYVRASDGKHGIWICGALRANLSAQHARDLMGAKPSGDWRQMRPGGPLEMLGVHAVNEPGYPVPRLVASAQLPSGDRVSLAFADDAAADRRIAVLAASAEGIDGLAALAEG